MFQKQEVMRKVLYSLFPIYLWSIWLYGWRSLALGVFVFLVGISAEYVMERARGKKVSEATLVTCALFTLSLPPALPFFVAGIGILFAMVFVKGVFGGFGRNIYNPAVAGRVFVYVAFPLMMQTAWMLPGNFGLGGMNAQALGSSWPEAVVMNGLALAVFLLLRSGRGETKVILRIVLAAALAVIAFYIAGGYLGLRGPGIPWIEVDVLSTATPFEAMRGLTTQNNWVAKSGWEYLGQADLVSLFFGLRAGSMGEGPIFLILGAAVYLISTKTANWRPMLGTLVAAIGFSLLFYHNGAMAARLPGLTPDGKDFIGQATDILRFLMAGSLAFGLVFMATDPVSAPKKPSALFLYGLIIGGVTVAIRLFSGFPEGISFGILCANTFASLLDELLPKKRKGETQTSAAPASKALPNAGQDTPAKGAEQ